MFLKASAPGLQRTLRRLAAATFLSGAAMLPAAANGLQPVNKAPASPHTDTLNGPELFFSMSQRVGAPQGYVDFCEREQQECAGDIQAGKLLYVEMSRQRWAILADVNLHFNTRIRQMTDQQIYNKTEYWTLPRNGAGDCEDIAMAKRNELIQRGWPRSALLLSVVKDNQGDHVVLTVVTDKGMFALDNVTNDIKLWSKTGYRYQFAQNPARPYEWLSTASRPSASWDTLMSKMQGKPLLASRILADWEAARPDPRAINLRSSIR